MNLNSEVIAWFEAHNVPYKVKDRDDIKAARGWFRLGYRPPQPRITLSKLTALGENWPSMCLNCLGRVVIPGRIEGINRANGSTLLGLTRQGLKPTSCGCVRDVEKFKSQCKFYVHIMGEDGRGGTRILFGNEKHDVDKHVHILSRIDELKKTRTRVDMTRSEHTVASARLLYELQEELERSDHIVLTPQRIKKIRKYFSKVVWTKDNLEEIDQLWVESGKLYGFGKYATSYSDMITTNQAEFPLCDRIVVT